MSDYIVKFVKNGKFLRFEEDSGNGKSVDASEASAFSSAEEAWVKLQEYAKLQISKKQDLDLPGWVRAVGELTLPSAQKLSLRSIKRSFEFQVRPSMADICGVVDRYYVHSAQSGWLVRNWRKNDDRALCWGANFALAVGFACEQSARDACASLSGGYDASILLAKSVFVDVNKMSVSDTTNDPVCDELRAACQAREIAMEIENGVKERLLAHEQNNLNSKKKSSRL